MPKIIAIRPGDKFIVTGVYANSTKHFPAKTFNTYEQAKCINLWRGHIWLLRDGKRILIRSVHN
jgi:hypothetical protein